jgi:hypothetical protein
MKDADIEALVADLNHLIATCPVFDTPSIRGAASALTSLKAELDRLSFKYGKALANWDRSLTRAETAERERDEARAEVERLRSERSYIIGWNDGFAEAQEQQSAEMAKGGADAEA